VIKNRKLRLVHLSDIHFSHRQAKFGFDPDLVLREHVVNDISNLRSELGPMDAILVSGDIAYAGKKPEYENAAAWLEEVTTAAGCDPTSVWLSPGNHDIDQDVIKANPTIQDSHNAIRAVEGFQQRDSELTRRLVQPQACALYYAPLAEFNEFAARYQSSFYADEHNYAWETDFPLNDGSTLRLRGLNTALLSGLADIEKSLFLGARAWTFPQRQGVEYMTLAHHPPNWLGDTKEAQKALEDHARIQLFGHEHDQRVQPGRDWIKLFAGSINPHRSELGWKPGYNIVEVYVETGTQRVLAIDVHAREWQANPPLFRALQDRNGEGVYKVRIPVADLPTEFDSPFAIMADSGTAPRGDDVTSEIELGSSDKEVSFRSIVYRFFRLSLSKKNEIVGHLDLVREGDSRLTDVERFKLALLRAKEAALLSQVAEFIDRLESEK
jgi:calcineurin-like phosphoesterase family protein